jgi:N-acetylmuramoyl-L-alanine amidase
MLVIKKKILILTSILMIIILSLLTAFTISSGASKIIPKKEINIVIDAGHGGIDRGAVSYSKKNYESDINLEIALKLKKQFETADIGVIMTRSDKNGLYGSKTEGFKKRDMLKRKEIIANSGADLVISIHLNKYPTLSRKGAQTFFKPSCELGTLAAKKIQEQLNKEINLDRAYPSLKGDYYILNCSDIPSVICECGFISNPEEEQLLINPQYQDKIAYNIFSGIISYFYEISMMTTAAGP